MNIMLDIIGSLVIRGAIVLVILRLNVSLHQTLCLKTATSNVRAKLGTMVSVIETDFRQAGYNVSGFAFVQFDSSDVRFLGDTKNNGTIDTVRFYLTGTSVYRKVSNSPTTICLGVGVTQMKFEYFDITGVKATTAILKRQRNR